MIYSIYRVRTANLSGILKKGEVVANPNGVTLIVCTHMLRNGTLKDETIVVSGTEFTPEEILNLPELQGLTVSAFWTTQWEGSHEELGRKISQGPAYFIGEVCSKAEYEKKSGWKNALSIWCPGGLGEHEKIVRLIDGRCFRSPLSHGKVLAPRKQ